jgi:hypothetical protein
MINKNRLKANKKSYKGNMSVKLRKKNLAGGKKSLYLDTFINGQRHYDFLKLYLLKGNEAKTKLQTMKSLYLPKQSEPTEKVKYNLQIMTLYLHSNEMPTLLNTSKSLANARDVQH